jgi:hypothetical protein
MNHGDIDGLTVVFNAIPRKRYLIITKDDYEYDPEKKYLRSLTPAQNF